MNGKIVVVGVSGGIAAYKAATLCSALTKAGAQVHVIMTENATRFIAPLTFQSLVKTPVITNIFDEPDASEMSHIALADKADLIIVAPATANLIGKIAHGIADDMLTTTLLVTRAPVWIAPAMNINMYENPVVQSNMKELQNRGYRIIEPGEGLLACGWVGKGRLAEPEEIFGFVQDFFETKRDLEGRKVIVTAGGTRERIDPVRYLTNDSSGKMGYAVAQAARDRGAEVVLVTGPCNETVPRDVHVISVESAQQMYQAVMNEWKNADVYVGAAAVADYRPKTTATSKIKKQDDVFSLELVKNVDILHEVGHSKQPGQVVIGFAAETQDLIDNALGKLHRKQADLIVANDVTQEGAGFGKDTNIVTFVRGDDDIRELPQQSKIDVAHAILDEWLLLAGEGQ